MLQASFDESDDITRNERRSGAQKELSDLWRGLRNIKNMDSIGFPHWLKILDRLRDIFRRIVLENAQRPIELVRDAAIIVAINGFHHKRYRR